MVSDCIVRPHHLKHRTIGYDVQSVLEAQRMDDHAAFILSINVEAEVDKAEANVGG